MNNSASQKDNISQPSSQKDNISQPSSHNDNINGNIRNFHDKNRRNGSRNMHNGSGFRRGGFRDNKKDLENLEDKPKVRMTPEQIRNFVFDEDFKFQDQDFNIDPRILIALQQNGFRKPTEIQRQILSIQDSDIIAQSYTGSGKTLAFVIPILNDILITSTQALILAPTREVAFQISDLVNKIKEFCNITSITLVGGVPISRQISRLKSPVDIMIATPGRVVDLLNRKNLNLSGTKIVALDEFDRMFDLGFKDDIRAIMTKCNPKSRKFMFSATLNDKIKQDSLEYLKEPKIVTIQNNSDTSVNINIKQSFEHYDGYQEKKTKLYDILKEHEGKTILIFVNTKSEAERLADDLKENNFKSRYIHGDLHQKKRQIITNDFRAGCGKILVATDLLGRGIDMLVGLVINYDFPKNTEDYTHRIGRTARGEDKEGASISFLSNRDISPLRELVKMLKVTIENKKILDLMNSPPSRTGGFRQKSFSGGRSFSGSRSFSNGGSSRFHKNDGFKGGSREYNPNRERRDSNRDGDNRFYKDRNFSSKTEDFGEKKSSFRPRRKFV